MNTSIKYLLSFFLSICFSSFAMEKWTIEEGIGNPKKPQTSMSKQTEEGWRWRNSFNIENIKTDCLNELHEEMKEEEVKLTSSIEPTTIDKEKLLKNTNVALARLTFIYNTDNISISIASKEDERGYFPSDSKATFQILDTKYQNLINSSSSEKTKLFSFVMDLFEQKLKRVNNFKNTIEYKFIDYCFTKKKDKDTSPLLDSKKWKELSLEAKKEFALNLLNYNKLKKDFENSAAEVDNTGKDTPSLVKRDSLAEQKFHPFIIEFKNKPMWESLGVENKKIEETIESFINNHFLGNGGSLSQEFDHSEVKIIKYLLDDPDIKQTYFWKKYIEKSTPNKPEIVILNIHTRMDPCEHCSLLLSLMAHKIQDAMNKVPFLVTVSSRDVYGTSRSARGHDGKSTDSIKLTAELENIRVFYKTLKSDPVRNIHLSPLD